jgi:small subunit ribosomal protein S4
MVRFRGPKNRIARRFGANIFGRARNPLLHKPNPPGMHGAKKKKKSDYGVQLEEQQKLKAMYGMLSRSQLLRYYKEADTSKDPTPLAFIRCCESRLDNIVYRLRFAPTIFAAQQLVSHGHIHVNGRKVDRRSFRVLPGMEISVRAKSQKIPVVTESIKNSSRSVPEYLVLEEEKFSGKILTAPEIDQVPLAMPINIPLVCEFLAHGG